MQQLHVNRLQLLCHSSYLHIDSRQPELAMSMRIAEVPVAGSVARALRPTTLRTLQQARYCDAATLAARSAASSSTRCRTCWMNKEPAKRQRRKRSETRMYCSRSARAEITWRHQHDKFGQIKITVQRCLCSPAHTCNRMQRRRRRSRSSRSRRPVSTGPAGDDHPRSSPGRGDRRPAGVGTADKTRPGQRECRVRGYRGTAEWLRAN